MDLNCDNYYGPGRLKNNSREETISEDIDLNIKIIQGIFLKYWEFGTTGKLPVRRENIGLVLSIQQPGVFVTYIE